MAIDKFFFPHKLMYIPEGQRQFIDYSPCRDQPNKGGQVITEGERIGYVFKSIVWIPKHENSIRFLPGQKIRIVGERGETRLEGKVVRFVFGGLEEDCVYL